MERKIATNVVTNSVQIEHSATYWSIDRGKNLGGSEIYLQDGVNGKKCTRHGKLSSQCYESSRISLLKWAYLSVIFSAQISRLEQQCVPHHLVEAVDGEGLVYLPINKRLSGLT